MEPNKLSAAAFKKWREKATKQYVTFLERMRTPKAKVEIASSGFTDGINSTIQLLTNPEFGPLIEVVEDEDAKKDA